MFAPPVSKKAKPSTEAKSRAEPSNSVKQPSETNPLWQSLARRNIGSQTKLAISAPSDPSEQEADRVADSVMPMNSATLHSPTALSSSPIKVQRMCDDCKEEDDELHRKEASPNTAAIPAAPAAVQRALSSPGRPLDSATRAFMEPRFGRDFSGVRVHADAEAAESARAVNARAYTFGGHIVLGPNQAGTNSESELRLLAHELAHVTQQSSGQQPAAIQRQTDTPPPRSRLPLSGDAERVSPTGGVPVRNGTLAWTLRFAGEPGSTTVSGGAINIIRPMDVRMDVSFTPTGTVSCPTITFIQIVRATIGGMPVHAHLLFIRDAAGFAADLNADRSTESVAETEPFYGAGPVAGGAGLGPESNFRVGGGAAGRSAQATMADGPDFPASSIPPGRTLVREFEVAAICAETGETFGSVRWGYTKTSTGTITLAGGQVSDVQTSGASAQVESARQAYYAGFFQHSLSGFARGQATLTPAHRQVLQDIATIGNVRRIILVGANDFSGGPEASAALSLRRAEAARNYLVNDLHVDASLITVEGHGVEARVPNAAGASVAANRRVDIHLDRGRLPTAAPEEAGSAREEMNLRYRDPHLIFGRLIDTILELQATTGTVPAARCRQLSNLVWALHRWRRLDPSVPSDEPYREAITAIRARCASDIPRAPFHWELPPLEPPSFLPRIEEATHGPPF